MALGDTAEQAAEKVASGQEPRPQRLKPHSKQCSYRSAEALRHPKSRAKSSFSATGEAVPFPKPKLPRVVRQSETGQAPSLPEFFPQASRYGHVGARFILHVLGRVHAQLTQFGDQVPGPAVNIVLLDHLAHAADAHLLVFGFHL